MSFLRVLLFTLISNYLLLQLGFCKACQNCLVTLIQITTVDYKLNTYSDTIQQNSTVVSEKKGTFICELIVERYIYLRNTQKQPKITNYGRNKSFLEFFLVYNGVCLKLPG